MGGQDGMSSSGRHKKFQTCGQGAAEPAAELRCSQAQVDESGIMDIREYTPAASEIMFSYVDVTDGSVHQFSVRDCIMDTHMIHAAIVYGGPRLGKTPLNQIKGRVCCSSALPAAHHSS